MRFSDVLDSGVLLGGIWTAEVSQDWMQGRSVFGGLQGALALRAMRALVPKEVPLRVLQMVFVAPMDAGRIEIQPRVLRTGRNAIHAEARILLAGQVASIVLGVFGRSRESRVKVLPTPPASPCQRGSVIARSRGALLPDFAQHFSMRWLSGSEPFSGFPDRFAVIEVGLRDDARVLEEHVLAIADAPPPVAFSFLEKPAMGSSLAWKIEMLGVPFEHMALEGWRLHVELHAAGDGYTDQSILVCGPTGDPVALSRQSMVIFEQADRSSGPSNAR